MSLHIQVGGIPNDTSPRFSSYTPAWSRAHSSMILDTQAPPPRLTSSPQSRIMSRRRSSQLAFPPAPASPGTYSSIEHGPENSLSQPFQLNRSASSRTTLRKRSSWVRKAREAQREAVIGWVIAILCIIGISVLAIMVIETEKRSVSKGDLWAMGLVGTEPWVAWEPESVPMEDVLL